MKIYVPKNHNELLLSDIKYGECFWYYNSLYIKTNAVHYNNLIRQDNSCSLDGVRLSDGLLFHWFDDPVVLMESDVAVFESSRNV